MYVRLLNIGRHTQIWLSRSSTSIDARPTQVCIRVFSVTCLEFNAVKHTLYNNKIFDTFRASWCRSSFRCYQTNF